MKLITGLVFAFSTAVAATRGHSPAGAQGGDAFRADGRPNGDDVAIGAIALDSPSVATQLRTFADDPADSLYRAARETMNKGDFRRAATLFRQVVDKYPRSSYVPDAMYYQAFSLARMGTERELRQALDVLAEQQKKFPDAANRADAGTLATRIRGALAQRGDPDAVRRLIEDAGGDESTAALDAEARADADADKADARAEKADARAAKADAREAARSSRGARSGASKSPCSDGDDDDTDMRIAALNALMQMDSDRAMPILKKVLARRDACSEVLRRKAVFIVAQKQSSESADLLINAARNDPDEEVRQQAVFWLSEVHSDRAIAALDSLLRESKDQELQEKAIFAISNTNTARGAEILRRFAESNAPEELRAKAVFWLGQSARRNYPDNEAFLRQLFDKTQSEEIQGAIIQAIAEGSSEENARWLLSEVLNTKQTVETRKKALFWAGQQHRFDVNLLVPLYDKITDQELKEHFIFVLSERRESVAMDKLITIAKTDKDREMRKKALFWLAQKNDPRVKQLLMEIIDQ
jgi:HEAT repeat protein